MTASEKLRALTERVLAGPATGLTRHDETLFGVLPLIADVVEAAEPCSDWVYITQEDSDALHAAITALRDALETK